MPILTISSQTLEFQAFWCDARDSEPGLVALAFDQYLPPDWGLVVTGDYGGKRHGLLLCELAKDSPEGRSLIGVPVPASWNNFTLILTPFAEGAVGPHVTVEFARQPPQSAVSAATGNVLHVVATQARIEAKLRTRNAALPSQLRLYQYMAGDTILPSRRTANFSTAPYRLDVRLPSTSIVMDPWPRRADPDDGALKIQLHARGEEAIRAIVDTLLWYASQAQVAPSEPLNLNFGTLGTFEPPEEHGFISIKGAWRKPDVMEFTVRGATPGDVFCLAPGLEDAAIALGSEPAPEAPDAGLMVFELDRDGHAVRLAGPTLERWNSDRAFNRGPEHEKIFKPLLMEQLTRIRREWAGGKSAIRGLALGFANASDGHRGNVSAIEEALDSPAQFALCAVLLDELLRRAGTEAANLMNIIEPDQARIAERICSAATWRAAGDEPSRMALSQLTAGTYHAPDGLRAIFETVFHEQTESGNDRDAADRWYDQTDADPAARAALLAIERQQSDRAWILIRAQVKPDLADLGANDLADVITFCQSQLLKPSDLALSDAIRFAYGSLEQSPDLSAIAAELHDRIKSLEAAAPAPPKMFLAVDQLRRLRAEIKDDALAARLGRIRRAFEWDEVNADIPHFERGLPPLDGGAGATDLIAKLDEIGKLPHPWNSLRDAATSEPWPNGALAALLATLTHYAPKEPSPRHGEEQKRNIPDDALLNAAATDNPQTEADARAVGFLLDGAAAATEFIDQLKKSARDLVAENERELSERNGIGNARRQTAARAMAHIELTAIIQGIIDKRLRKIKEISDWIGETLAGTAHDVNDPARKSRLYEVSRTKDELDKRYGGVRLALIDRRNSGRALLDKEALEDVGRNLDMADKAWIELSHLSERIRENYRGAGEGLP